MAYVQNPEGSSLVVGKRRPKHGPYGEARQDQFGAWGVRLTERGKEIAAEFMVQYPNLVAFFVATTPNMYYTLRRHHVANDEITALIQEAIVFAVIRWRPDAAALPTVVAWNIRCVMNRELERVTHQSEAKLKLENVLVASCTDFSLSQLVPYFDNTVIERERAAAARTHLDRYLQALDLVDPMTRRIFVLVTGYGTGEAHSYRNAAAEVGLTQRAVMHRFKRAVRLINKFSRNDPVAPEHFEV